jgi:hypothetical protein
VTAVAVIDFETTGLSPGMGDRATEIGIVLLEGDTVVDRFQSLMNAGVRISAFIEAYTGITKIKVLSEPFRMEENLGLDFLGIPGTNGPSRLYGGWPQFNVTNLSMIGYAGSENSPYLDDNWQYQYSANATWVSGNHTFRFTVTGKNASSTSF